jgi:transposase
MPAAIAISLPAGARWQLEQLRRGARDGRLITRAIVVLMTADQCSVEEIRRATGFSKAAVWKWRKRYVQSGIEGLYDRPRSGGPPKADKAYLRLLRKTVMRSPRKLGFAFTVWTADRLAKYLADETGVRLSSNWVMELLKEKLGFSYQRPKHTLKGKRDEKDHRRAQKRLAELKKRLSRTNLRTNSGTKTKRSSISTPTSPLSGPPEVASRVFRVRVRTRSGWSTVPLTSPRAKLSTTSAKRKAVWASMTW